MADKGKGNPNPPAHATTCSCGCGTVTIWPGPKSNPAGKPDRKRGAR